MMRDSILTLKRSLKISLQTKGKLSIFISILGFFMAFLPTIVAKELAKLTNSLQLLMSDTKILDTSLKIFSVLVILFITQAVFYFLQGYTRQIDTINTIHYIRKTILYHKCDVKYKYIENHDKFHERIEFVNSYAGTRTAMCMQNIITIIQRTITFISVTYALYAVNPLIVFVLLITSIPAVIIAYMQKGENFRYETKWMEEGHLSIHFFHICVNEESMCDVRHYGLIDYLKARWLAISDNYCGKKKKIVLKHVKYNSVADFLRNIVYIAVLLFAAYSIYKNPSIGLGVFTLVFTLSNQMQEVTAGLFIEIMQLVNYIPYIKEFFYLDELEKDTVKDSNNNEKYLDKSIKRYTYQDSIKDTQKDKSSDGKIEFHNVSFSYPNTESLVLKNINVTIQDGEKLAIVGDNGSGKSTFISLLCGMFDPNIGNIKIANKDLLENLSDIRKNISVVFQDFGRYEATLRNNITISDKERHMSDEELLTLAKQVNAMDVIEEQENGLDEMIGSFAEKGNNLSGGQWQKISLLRAAYRKDAKIMILDEPTAALDPIAETQLYKDFSNITGDKTTILISHRLGITSVVDRILVFRDGEIIEDGNHQELMNQNGHYAKLYRAQAQWYH